MNRQALSAEHDELAANWISNPSTEAWERMEEIRVLIKQSYIDEELAAGNVDGALALFGSEAVAGAIVKLAPALTDDQLRGILRDEWTRCEAHQPHRADFIDLFRRVGFVTDVEGELPARLRGKTVTVYRGNLGEDEPVGIAWTLNRKTAEFFARAGMSLRGKFLGLYREDGVPSIWQAKMDPAEALAYFDGRSEKEVVVDPATLRDVRMIAQAVAA